LLEGWAGESQSLGIVRDPVNRPASGGTTATPSAWRARIPARCYNRPFTTAAITRCLRPNSPSPHRMARGTGWAAVPALLE